MFHNSNPLQYGIFGKVCDRLRVLFEDDRIDQNHAPRWPPRSMPCLQAWLPRSPRVPARGWRSVAPGGPCRGNRRHRGAVHPAVSCHLRHIRTRLCHCPAHRARVPASQTWISSSANDCSHSVIPYLSLRRHLMLAPTPWPARIQPTYFSSSTSRAPVHARTL